MKGLLLRTPHTSLAAVEERVAPRDGKAARLEAVLAARAASGRELPRQVEVEIRLAEARPGPPNVQPADSPPIETGDRDLAE